MSRANALKLAVVGFATLPLLALTGSPPATVGPPWLSVEVPANPMDQAMRGAAMVVRAFHHDRPAGITVAGTAEGLVNGERKTVVLQFKQTAHAGVYALTQQWPSEGTWLLNITAQGHAGTSLIIELGRDGGVTAGRFHDWSVPSVAIHTTRVVQGSLEAGTVDAYLKELARAVD